MILVDSSVWIDYFLGNDTPQVEILHRSLGVREVGVGDLVLTEVLQGFREDKDYRIARSIMGELTVFEMLGKDLAIKSAENFRKLRKQGITVRKTADVIIATYCIEHGIPLLFSDKDFKPFVQHLQLTEVQ
ncbi:MAG: twitching motility protein PilT [Gammaproteobacteria bacterium RIFCSPLOWO2_02_FULL_57_10]|nr:MAG: twitching motility protein PilT [Gammaproteobacteria bacterium RIFCSPLOWO2_02_FULL_57_10]